MSHYRHVLQVVHVMCAKFCVVKDTNPVLYRTHLIISFHLFNLAVLMHIITYLVNIFYCIKNCSLVIGLGVHNLKN